MLLMSYSVGSIVEFKYLVSVHIHLQEQVCLSGPKVGG